MLEAVRSIKHSGDAAVHGSSIRCQLQGRRITEKEWQWAQAVLARTGGRVQALPDGIGDDYKAMLYRQIHEEGEREFGVEQVCVAIGDFALMSFPGELYAEDTRRLGAAVEDAVIERSLALLRETRAAGRPAIPGDGGFTAGDEQ